MTSLASIIAGAEQECAAFADRRPTAETYRIALFHRAIVGGCGEAWAALHRLYRPQMVRWVWLCRAYRPWLGDHHDLADASFARFWRAMTPQRFAGFAGVAPLLRYLQQCVITEVIDAQRTYRESASLDAVTLPSYRLSDRLARRDAWDVLCGVLRGDDERTLIYALFVECRTPRAVPAAYGTLFPTVATVRRVQHRVMERLRRNDVVIGLWQEYR